MRRLLAIFLVSAICFVAAATAFSPLVDIVPTELTNAILHNPDMGWVVTENYALDKNPGGSSTLLAAPGETFSNVDNVTLMFSWQDIERSPDNYDFSRADFAYDYWAKRGKAIQLRMSATSLLWWATQNPPAGKGAPDYVRAHLSPNEKQRRYITGVGYDVEDARNPYYREHLGKFLRAVNAHFSGQRPVTLIDLRGFGLWGEWHSGFQYATLRDRRAALKGIIDVWSDSLPGHPLALSFSYDPDGPQDLYPGSTRTFDAKFTTHYDEFKKFSAFDYALAKTNVTWRRDGCGGAVHSNERKLSEEAFQLGRAPFFSEFVAGYGDAKKSGGKWVKHQVEDALSLHPNYVMLMGWQAPDALDFLKQRPDLIEEGLQRMGYRFVPTRVQYSSVIANRGRLNIRMEWVNRGVGHALRDYQLQLCLIPTNKEFFQIIPSVKLPTSQWIAGKTYAVTSNEKTGDIGAGNYQLGVALHDNKTGRFIELPLAETAFRHFYSLGNLTVSPDK